MGTRINRFQDGKLGTCIKVNRHKLWISEIDVQYRRLVSNGKIDFHVVQVALFVKFKFTCLSVVSDTVKWSQMDSILLSLVKWSNCVLLLEHSGCKASESN